MQLDNERFLKHRELAKDCWFLTGATATGKSRISLALAKILNAEIISMDSMAVYQGMDIGTAKPNKKSQDLVTHHLIDIVQPTHEFSVSEYYRMAFGKIEEIQGKGRPVLFVGGTALYLKSILRGAFEGPPADWDFRNQIMEELKTIDQAQLHHRLQMVDPLSANKLHPNDTRRIIRALEVNKITGFPISHLQTQFEEGSEASENRVFAIGHPRTRLHQRIDCRVEKMFSDGFVEEVQRIRETHTALGKTAAQAVGYKEVLGAIENNDDLSKPPILNELMDRVKFRTHQFARHQETWFRGLSEVRWIEPEKYSSTPDETEDLNPETADKIAEDIAKQNI